MVPLLKKSNLDKSEINNYRPVSILSFISKIIERVVARQFFNYLNHNDLIHVYQSGHRQFHSTETALLQILSVLFAAVDAQNASLLAFLDMGAALDCVDHDILLKRLDNSFGVTGTVALWFKSYLNDRTRQVLFKNKFSEVDVINSGVPKGSFFGPILFLLYTSDVFKIIDKFGFVGHGLLMIFMLLSPVHLMSLKVQLISLLFVCQGLNFGRRRTM